MRHHEDLLVEEQSSAVDVSKYPDVRTRSGLAEYDMPGTHGLDLEPQLLSAADRVEWFTQLLLFGCLRLLTPWRFLTPNDPEGLQADGTRFGWRAMQARESMAYWLEFVISSVADWVEFVFGYLAYLLIAPIRYLLPTKSEDLADSRDPSLAWKALSCQESISMWVSFVVMTTADFVESMLGPVFHFMMGLLTPWRWFRKPKNAEVLSFASNMIEGTPEDLEETSAVAWEVQSWKDAIGSRIAFSVCVVADSIEWFAAICIHGLSIAFYPFVRLFEFLIRR